MVVLLATALLIPAPAQTKEVTAVIRLRDGELASHMMVDVGYRPAGLTRNFTVQTRLRSNADGEVTFKLPAEGSHEVVVDVFDKPTRADLPVDVVSASQTVSLPTARNLVFQCRGSGDLKVEIRPGNELPEEVRFRIDITRQCVRYRRAIRRRELTQEGGKIEFADLHPGEYKVRLMVDDYIDMKWERTIQVADGSRKNMVLPLPEIQFGSVLGKVMRLGDSQ